MADLREVSERGLWEVKGRPVNGLALRLVWLAEALVFLGSFLADFTRRTRRPYSEEEGRFFELKTPALRLILPPDSRDLAERLASGEFGCLGSAQEEPDPGVSHLTAAIHHLPDSRVDYLTVYANVMGKNKPERKVLVDRAEIPKSLADRILGRAAK